MKPGGCDRKFGSLRKVELAANNEAERYYEDVNHEAWRESKDLSLLKLSCFIKPTENH